MRPIARTMVWLAVFLIVDSAVYMATAREWTGGPLIAATAVAFAYLALVLRGAVRRAAREAEAAPSEQVGAVELDHVGPTIWPAGFAVASLMIVPGIVVVRGLLIPGGLVFVASAVGWARDIHHQHAHHPSPEAGAEAVSPGSGTLAP